MATEPVTDLQWGIANWTDYEHNWREKDAEYLQARTIPRFHGPTDRDAARTPSVGMVVYNETTDRLEWRSKTNTWWPIHPMPLNMAVGLQDTAAGVVFAHAGATGKGIQFTPTEVKSTLIFDVLTGTFRVTDAGATLKSSGMTTVALTTDATSFVIDKPVKAPSLTLTGTGTVIDATGKTVVVGTLTSTLVTATNINLSGTLSGGVINGTSGTIGGVKLGITANQAEAPAGFVTQGAKFAGDGSRGVLNFPGLNGQVMVDRNVTLVTGTDGKIELLADVAVRNKAVSWYDSANVLRGNFALSVYSATDPGVANYPEGTIWFS